MYPLDFIIVRYAQHGLAQKTTFEQTYATKGQADLKDSLFNQEFYQLAANSGQQPLLASEG